MDSHSRAFAAEYEEFLEEERIAEEKVRAEKERLRAEKVKSMQLKAVDGSCFESKAVKKLKV
jgi:hypothetical protein